MSISTSFKSTNVFLYFLASHPFINFIPFVCSLCNDTDVRAVISNQPYASALIKLDSFGYFGNITSLNTENAI